MAFLPTENTKSTLLDKAACVPAEVQLLLQDPMTHAGLKEPMVMKECKLTDQLRQIPMSAGLGAPPPEEHMLDSIRDGLIKELIRSTHSKRPTHHTSDEARTKGGTCHTSQTKHV